MKIRNIIMLILVVTAGITCAQPLRTDNMTILHENESKFGFGETVEKLSEKITSAGWKITIIHDLQETMRKNGKTVLPVKVIELCNPEYAYQILGSDVYRNVSPMLPCRVSVYEKADGKTYISRMNAPAFSSMIGGDAEKTILQAYNDTEEILKDFIQ